MRNGDLTPIIFLTERDEDPDRISGLRLGADDYLTKTVSAAYLVARINASHSPLRSAHQRALQTENVG